MSAAVLEQVRQTVADVFDVSIASVGAEPLSESIEAWDSLGHVNMILALEQSFGIAFDVEEIPELLTVQAIVDAIVAKLP